MTIDYKSEVVEPYNQKYDTDYEHIEDLLSDMRYSGKKSWKSIDGILGVNKMSLMQIFKKSKRYIPGTEKVRDTLISKIMNYGKDKIAGLTMPEIRELFPGYSSNFYYILFREENIKYKPKQGFDLRSKILAYDREKMKGMTIHDFMKVFPIYTEAAFYNIFRMERIKYKAMRKK